MAAEIGRQGKRGTSNPRGFGHKLAGVKYLVTGGAGFIGCNAAQRWMERGHEVVVLDDLSRRGADRNLEWLRTRGRFTFERVDIRDAAAVDDALTRHRDSQVVLHLAAQVAVTTSVADPRSDFEVNALGTFNVLESVRRHAPSAVFLYASTNKVYGGLEQVGVSLQNGRHGFRDRPQGISEDEPLDFHSPYGCSKGAADQYVRDYARIYGLRTAVFRQSCIYGYRQFGVEDQGWVAWFTIAAVTGQPITIYGDGRQVRDLLFVDDLCDAYDAAVDRIGRVSGQVFNLGGGPHNTLSLLELVEALGRLIGGSVRPAFADWRPGDQPVFVADIRRASEALGWAPRIGVQAGVELLYRWVAENRQLFA
jgi:CDP-paratose 2-epimerase